MKNKILLAVLLLLFIFITGCNETIDVMHIDCEEKIIISTSVDVKVFYNHEEVSSENLKWTLSDYDIVSIIDGKIYANDYGKVTIGVIDITNPTHYCAKEVEVIPPYVTDIEVIGVNELKINKSTQLEAKVLPEIIKSEVIWASSNEEVIVVENGVVYAVGLGNADVIIKCDDFVKYYHFTVIPEPTFIEVYGDTNISINEVATFTYNIEEEVILESNNTNVVEIIDNAVLGTGIGKAIITAYRADNPSIKGTFEVNVDGSLTKIEMTTEELIKIEEIINSMTTQELIGQMFNVGINMYSSNWEKIEIDPSTGLPYAQFSRNDPKTSLPEYFKDYKIGNFTIRNVLGGTRSNLEKAVNTLNQMGKVGSVSPFITYEYSGGSGMKAISALPSNQSLSGATNQVIEEVSSLFASQLQALGINSVLSVYANTNPNVNDMLTTFGSDISKAITTANTVDKAYKNHGIVFIPDLSVMYNYTDDRTLEQLKSTDFKLLEAAIQNGTQMISLPLAMYTEFGGNYAYQNAQFVDEYIRKELGFNGVLMIDNSILNTFVYDGTLNQSVVDAINKGVDMISFDITFTTSRWSDYSYIAGEYLALYNYILESVDNGTISLDRVREAVARILLVKLRNNLLEEKQETSFDFEKVSDKIASYMPSFVTVYGNLYSIDKNEKVLFISESYEETATTNSVGDSVNKYAKARGYGNIQVYHTNTLRPEDILNSAATYKTIYISVDYVYDSKQIGFAANATNYLQFIESLRLKNPNICFIFTGNANTKDYFTWAQNYICLYGFYEDDFVSLSRILTQEATPNVKK